MPEQTPLYDLASRAGAAFTEDAGWLLAAHFGDPGAEYTRACQGAALFDVSHRGKIEITGPDAARFLHNLSTNDVVKLPPGSGQEAFLTTGQAKIVAYVLLFHRLMPDGTSAFWLDVAPGTAAKVAQHLEHYHITEQFELADRTRSWNQVHLAGPQADAILNQVFKKEPPSLGPLQHVTVWLGKIPCWIRRHDALGLPGYDVLSPWGLAGEVWQSFTNAGAVPSGLQVYQVLRVEAGTPVYGVDIDETNLPQEVGRTEQAVSFTKGCYIGQETIARIRTYGHVNRSLVGLKLAGTVAAPAGSKLFRDGKEVGQVTSSVVSPRRGTAIALGYVRRGSHELGMTLDVDVASARQAAEVVSLPFAGQDGKK
jgi:folate-binding protein YgfZ